MRTFLMPNFFTQEELGILDAPTASPFTMESVGGNHGQVVEPNPNNQVLQESEEAERGERRSTDEEKMGVIGGPSRERNSFQRTD